MIDVHLPTTDGREIILTRYTEPEPDLRLLLDRMKLGLAGSAAPQNRRRRAAAQPRPVVKTSQVKVLISLVRTTKIGPIREVGLTVAGNYAFATRGFGWSRQDNMRRLQ